jgi:hypothetical protein
LPASGLAALRCKPGWIDGTIGESLLASRWQKEPVSNPVPFLS